MTATGRDAAWVVAVLAICAAAVVVVASRAGRGAGGHDASATGPAGAGASIAEADPAVPPVRYSGPRRSTGTATLRAAVAKRPARTVAVTFLLDGEALGTDTEPPFALDVEAAHLPPAGTGSWRPRRRAGAPRSVEGGARGRRPRFGGILTATPEQGLDAALSALTRGHVTVRLGPGR